MYLLYTISLCHMVLWIVFGWRGCDVICVATGGKISVLNLMVVHLKGINYQQVWIFKYMVSLEALHWKYREDVRGYVTTVYSFLYSIYITKETNLLDT